jgi:hypothetical protein
MNGLTCWTIDQELRKSNRGARPHRSKVLSPHCADSLQWIFAPLTPSAHKERIIPCCPSLMHVVSGAATLIPLVMKDNKCRMKIRNVAATTGRFRAYGCVRIQQWGQSQSKRYEYFVDTFWLTLVYGTCFDLMPYARYWNDHSLTKHELFRDKDFLFCLPGT